jgi:hypothetical protein
MSCLCWRHAMTRGRVGLFVVATFCLLICTSRASHATETLDGILSDESARSTLWEHQETMGREVTESAAMSLSALLHDEPVMQEPVMQDAAVAPAAHMATVDGGGQWDWRDTLTVFGGYEGSKQPQDFGVNANFGGRASVNFGAPLWDEYGLGMQVGTSINATANAVQVVERVGEDTSRTQNFTTVGLFQRTPGGLIWGLGYDFLYQDSYDTFFLGQWRGRAGYYVNWANEIGVQGAFREKGDTGQFNATTVLLRPITQGSVYWRHTFGNQTQAGCFVGMAEGHSEANYALGDLPRQDNPLVFGSDVFVPVSDRLAIFGEANFMTPMDTGAVDAYFGVEVFPWGGAKLARKNAYRPVLPVANSTSMTIDLLR